jgi:hypothetical protein
VVVPVEEGLHTVTTQEDRILSHLFCVVILPFTVGVLLIEVVGFWRDKGRLHLLVEKFVPVVVLKPDMLLYFLRTIQTQPVNGLSLYQFVDEVSCLQTPPWWHIPLPDLNLLCQDVVPDLLPVLANVRSLAKHTFISNDSHSKVVHCHSMVLTTHHFRS